MVTDSASTKKCLAAPTARAASALPFQEIDTRAPKGGGTTGGATRTGRPVSKSAVLRVMVVGTSESGVGRPTTMRSVTRPCRAIPSSSRPVSSIHAADTPSGPGPASITGMSPALQKSSNARRAFVALSSASFSASSIISSIMAPDMPSPSSGTAFFGSVRT